MARGATHKTAFPGSTRRTLRTTLAAGLLALWGMAGGAVAGEVELVSRVHPDQISETGIGRSLPSQPAPLTSPQSVSADGRYVVFVSEANNLVPGQIDRNASPDVFLHDVSTGTTVLVSRSMSSPARTGNMGSWEAALSANGRYVVFTSRATDLVPGQTSLAPFFDDDLLLYDRVTGTIELIAQISPDAPGHGWGFGGLAINENGRYIAFTSGGSHLVPGQFDNPGLADVFLYDRVEKKTRLVSHASESLTRTGNKGSWYPVISADGRYVAFVSEATDLVPGPQNLLSVFLYDRRSETLTLVGQGGAAVISNDGRYVAFSGLNRADLYDRDTRQTTPLSELTGSGLHPMRERPLAISGDGRFVAFVSSADNLVPGQQGDALEALFLYDRIARTFTLGSRRHDAPTAPGNRTANPSISADGRYVVFASLDPDIVAGQSDGANSLDVFLFDRISGKTRLVSGMDGSATATGGNPSFFPVISANGSRIAFVSEAPGLVEGLKDFNQAIDVFVHDTASRETSAVSLAAPDVPSLSAAGGSAARDLSADGRFVAFESGSAHLVRGQADANGSTDVFLYDRVARTTLLVSRSRASATTTGNGRSFNPVISADGRYVAFDSRASDLAGGEAVDPSTFGIFLFDRITGRTRRAGRSSLAQLDLLGEFRGKSLSADGRYLVFLSDAADLVPGQVDTNGEGDLFLYDQVTGGTTLVSRSSAGAAIAADGFSYSAVLSADGRYIAFGSRARDLVPGQSDLSGGGNVFLYDRVTGGIILLNRVGSSPAFGTGSAGLPSLSADGRFIVFPMPDDPFTPGGDYGIYVHDRIQGTNTRIASGDGRAHPRISADGRFVAFLSSQEVVPGLDPGTHVQIYLYDRVAKTLALVTRPSAASGSASRGDARDHSISADGRFIAFASDATDLVPGLAAVPGYGWQGIFLFDRTMSTMTLVSRSGVSPATARGLSEKPLLSASGRQVAFTSIVEDLVLGDLNLQPDAFLYLHDASVGGGPVPLPRCMLLDTRRAGDGPALRSNSRRVLKAHSACGVPSRAKSVSVKVTVFQPAGKGNLRFYPGNSTTAQSGILRFERGQTRSGSFTLPLATNGAGTLAILPAVSGNGTVHVAVEVNGYVE